MILNQKSSWILTDHHVEQVLGDVTTEIESEKSLCLGRQLVPIITKRQSLVKGT